MRREGRDYACKVVRLDPREEGVPETVRTEPEHHRLCQGHPGVLRLRRAWRRPGAAYLLTDLCRAVLREGDPVRPGTLRAVAQALRHCHRRGVVHADVKAENVGLLPSGRAVLLDFGLSVRLPGDGVPRRGTPLYAAPEVLRREPWGAACDVWSLGVALFRGAAGRFPFDHPDREGLFRRIEAAEPDLAAVPDPGLRDLLAGMLAKAPGERLGLSGCWLTRGWPEHQGGAVVHHLLDHLVHGGLRPPRGPALVGGADPGAQPAGAPPGQQPGRLPPHQVLDGQPQLLGHLDRVGGQVAPPQGRRVVQQPLVALAGEVPRVEAQQPEEVRRVEVGHAAVAHVGGGGGVAGQQHAHVHQGVGHLHAALGEGGVRLAAAQAGADPSREHGGCWGVGAQSAPAPGPRRPPRAALLVGYSCTVFQNYRKPRSTISASRPRSPLAAAQQLRRGVAAAPHELRGQGALRGLGVVLEDAAVERVHELGALGDGHGARGRSCATRAAPAPTPCAPAPPAPAPGGPARPSPRPRCPARPPRAGSRGSRARPAPARAPWGSAAACAPPGCGTGPRAAPPGRRRPARPRRTPPAARRGGAW